MKIYEVNLNKKKKLLRSYVKMNIKNAGRFSKVCYALAVMLRVLAVVLATINIWYVAAVSRDELDLILLIITFGFPMILSSLPSTVYITAVGVEYVLRKEEKIIFTEDGLVYSHRDGRTGLTDAVYCDKVNYSDIDDVIVDGEVVEIHGDIIAETYENSELKDTLDAKICDFLNAYDEDIVGMIKNAMKQSRD